ncbi:DUF6879 family protein [Actinorugispora endophytica]|uniref:DUF6879 domain-containing protein n=1 Tax=Actinorugispora endophytica TaxID=1605990 RepID=A0A4R6UPW6_9ACTN|nr:DUF6879 family protein [Actinorugispora endophytica]TDQ49270.1 hypothetical protein EV190_11666 [Actinorugispora endophytica]
MTPQRGSHPVDEEEFEQLFARFRYTAFRLETLQHYSVDYEDAPFRRFLAGGQPEHSAVLSDWGEEIRAGIGEGRTYRRVHVVTEPLSDYVRFECSWGYPRNVAAGEDIRILAVPEGEWPEGIPRLDYWLFDSHRLLRMNYGPDGSMLTPELVEDPEQVVAANLWRDRALHLSVPFTEYQARFDAAMRPR